MFGIDEILTAFVYQGKRYPRIGKINLIIINSIFGFLGLAVGLVSGLSCRLGLVSRGVVGWDPRRESRPFYSLAPIAPPSPCKVNHSRIFHTFPLKKINIGNRFSNNKNTFKNFNLLPESFSKFLIGLKNFYIYLYF